MIYVRVSVGQIRLKPRLAVGVSAGRDSLLDMERALAVGAIGDTTHRGFHARNREVAKAGYLIAFTFGTGQEPAGGGTLHT